MSEPSTFGPPFNRWGTIAFEFEFMLEMIRYGRWMSDARTGESRWHDDPTCLEFAYWEEFVPEAYKEQIATMPAHEIFGPLLQGEADKRTRRQAIERLLEWIHANVEPR